MDNQKDIQKTDNLSNVLDGRAVRTNPFGENRAAERAYRRAERIVTAAHLVTNHVQPGEPTRVRLRNVGIELLSIILGLRDEMRTAASEKVGEAYKKIREMITLTRLLGASGLVSLQNVDVLTEALDELGNYITAAQRSTLAENVIVTREELMDTSVTETVNLKDKSVTVIKDMSRVRDTRTVSFRGGDRKKTAEVRVRNILDVVREGRELGIKEIAAHMPEIGEKTLQRELSDLVAKGQLRRIGLKRWSKYSLPV